MVTLTDPEGFPMNLIFGQTPASAGPYPDILEVNYEIEKPRVRRFQRFEPGPAAVHKVCHLIFHALLDSIISSSAVRDKLTSN